MMGGDAQAEEKKKRVRMEEPGGGGRGSGLRGVGRSQGGAAGLWTGASCRWVALTQRSCAHEHRGARDPLV